MRRTSFKTCTYANYSCLIEIKTVKDMLEL